MRRQQIAIIAIALWLTLIAAFMLITQRVDFEIFFVLCFMGLLMIVQFMQSNYVQPGYLRYMRYLVIAGLVMFCTLVVVKVLDILGWEIIIY